jgi:hypothetical protein
MAAKDEVEAGRRLIILILKRGLPALLQKLQSALRSCIIALALRLRRTVRWSTQRVAGWLRQLPRLVMVLPLAQLRLLAGWLWRLACAPACRRGAAAGAPATRAPAQGASLSSRTLSLRVPVLRYRCAQQG